MAAIGSQYSFHANGFFDRNGDEVQTLDMPVERLPNGLPDEVFGQEEQKFPCVELEFRVDGTKRAIFLVHASSNSDVEKIQEVANKTFLSALQEDLAKGIPAGKQLTMVYSRGRALSYTETSARVDPRLLNKIIAFFLTV